MKKEALLHLDGPFRNSKPLTRSPIFLGHDFDVPQGWIVSQLHWGYEAVGKSLLPFCGFLVGNTNMSVDKTTLCRSQHHSHRTSSCMAAAGPAKEYASHAGIVEACEGSEEPIALRASPIPLFLDDPWPLYNFVHGWLFL
jgi:hypothetical protein